MPFQSNVKVLWEDFVSLIYPEVCVHCGDVLVHGEPFLCMKCRVDLPITNYQNQARNPVFVRFARFRELVFAASFMHFRQHGIVQDIIHEMKYQGGYELAEELGKWFGKSLVNSLPASDMIIPIPLHVSKLRIRGYNQSEAIAMGLSQELGIPIEPSLLQRVRPGKTQTRRSRTGRWLNVEGVFRVSNATALAGKRIVLVDDVITSGATMDEAAEQLIKCGIGSLSIVSLATGIHAIGST